MTSPPTGGAWVRWSEDLGGILQRGWRWDGPGEPTCDAPASDPGPSDGEDAGHPSDAEQSVHPPELSAVEKGLSEVAAQVTSISNHLNSTQEAMHQVMEKDNNNQLKLIETSVTEAQRMLDRLGAKLEELKAEAAATARSRLAASESADSDDDGPPPSPKRPRLTSDLS